MIAALTRSRPDLKWHCGNIKQTDIPTQFYDGIISWGVVEHDEAGPQRALQEFHRILKTHGIAIVSVPIDSAYARRTSQVLFPPEQLAKEDGVFFQYFMSQQELSEFMQRQGFEILETAVLGGPSLAFVFPEMYRQLVRTPYLRIANLATRLLLSFRPGLGNMIVAVGRKV